MVPGICIAQALFPFGLLYRGGCRICFEEHFFFSKFDAALFKDNWKSTRGKSKQKLGMLVTQRWYPKGVPVEKQLKMNVLQLACWTPATYGPWDDVSLVATRQNSIGAHAFRKKRNLLAFSVWCCRSSNQSMKQSGPCMSSKPSHPQRSAPCVSKQQSVPKSH